MRALALLLVAFLAFARPAGADEFSDGVAALGAEGNAVAAIDALVALGDPRAIPVLGAMLEGELYVTEDGRVVAGRAEGRQLALTDAVTGEALGTVASRDVDKIRVNNRLRGVLRGAISRLEIADPDPARRLAAATELARDQSPETAAILKAAIAREDDPGVRAAMAFALAQTDLESTDPAERLAAVESLATVASPEVRVRLDQLLETDAAGVPVEPDEAVRAAAQTALDAIETQLELVGVALTLFQGISLGSVLLLAAVGLAITFGVMGVINMAHGEMIMLGAYTTYLVQQAFAALAPAAMDLYLVLSIPAAFLVAGAVGVAIERGVIRFLYGRPLETLLATWGLSLALQQAVRSIFGAPNKEVANPSWMTGGIELLGGLFLTYNRIVIIFFALAVLAAVAAVLRFTRYGLQMRAVMQNRPMASAMGIRTGRIDALTFGLGSGIAGVAGVALSQIGNVSPNLGQSYIVDSFMVVVFGGVGSLWGVLAGSMGLGIVNKLMEPYAGAVLGKILVLVAVILFIQRRPRGLFALRGRAAEA